MSGSLQKSHVADIVRLAYEGSTLDDLGHQVLSRINLALDASASLLYRCDQQGQVLALSGSLAEIHDTYMGNYFAEDIVQAALRRLNPWVLQLSNLPEWKDFRRLSFYNDLLRPREADHFYYIHLADTDHKQAGDVGIMVARSGKLPDFDSQDNLTVLRIFPALEGLVRRSLRNESRQRQSLAEAVCDIEPTARIALDLRGETLWISDRAATLLGMHQRARSASLDPLAKAARAFSELLRHGVASPPRTVSIPRADGPPLRAELHLVRGRSGERFLVAELAEKETCPQVSLTAARYRLTAAETQVLGLLAQGLADQEMAKRLFVSIATVRTHLGHIFEKLGVHSRIQAALLANGLKIESANDDSVPPSDPQASR